MSDDCYWSLDMHDFKGSQKQILESYMLRKDDRCNILLQRILMSGMLEECFTDPSNKEQIEQRMVTHQKGPCLKHISSERVSYC
ncbi:hypothetical protein P8452_75164 [Trifolium repens]|nr:hypothetical protein P8452_75164 [Trifolium repens]